MMATAPSHYVAGQNLKTAPSIVGSTSSKVCYKNATLEISLSSHPKDQVVKYLLLMIAFGGVSHAD